jgi:hypothetical protein
MDLEKAEMHVGPDGSVFLGHTKEELLINVALGRALDILAMRRVVKTMGAIYVVRHGPLEGK